MNRWRAILAAGVSLVPIRSDGTKAAAGAWKIYQSRRAAPEEIFAWWQRGHGVAAVGGKVSGNLECLDFDIRRAFETFREFDLPDCFAHLVEVATPSGGRHLWYRCAEPVGGNLKLAHLKGDSGEPKAIETRGEGGYAILPDSPPKCHPSICPYLYCDDRTLADVPTITAADRTALHAIAREMDESPRRSVQPAPRRALDGRYDGDLPSILDAFSADGPEWIDILGPSGWMPVRIDASGVTYWRRPGKERGISATTGRVVHPAKGYDLFHVFTSSGAPFEPGNYSRAAAVALLSFGGDFKALARELWARAKAGTLSQLGRAGR